VTAVSATSPHALQDDGFEQFVELLTRRGYFAGSGDDPAERQRRLDKAAEFYRTRARSADAPSSAPPAGTSSSSSSSSSSGTSSGGRSSSGGLIASASASGGVRVGAPGRRQLAAAFAAACGAAIALPRVLARL
jgi:hypothetical protein